MHTYKEGNKYTLSTDYYNIIPLLCTFVDETFAYMIDNNKKINYKKHLKNNKLYIFSTQYQSWDNIESNLNPVTEHDYHINNRLSAMYEFKGD